MLHRYRFDDEPPEPEPMAPRVPEDDAPAPPKALLREPPRRWPEGAVSGAILPASLESKSTRGWTLVEAEARQRRKASAAYWMDEIQGLLGGRYGLGRPGSETRVSRVSFL